MSVQSMNLQQALTEYIVREFLDGDGSQFDATTPLLEWGIIDSLSIVKLLTFVEERFGVVVPPETVTAENLETLGAFVKLIVGLEPNRAAATPS